MRVLLAIALACSIGCAARAPAGPAWPVPASREADGGESLAPRAAARAIAAVVEDDRAADRAGGDKPAAPAVAPAGDRAASSAAAPAAEEPLNLEEIVIEVE